MRAQQKQRTSSVAKRFEHNSEVIARCFDSLFRILAHRRIAPTYRCYGMKRLNFMLVVVWRSRHKLRNVCPANDRQIRQPVLRFEFQVATDNFVMTARRQLMAQMLQANLIRLQLNSDDR